jgi:hypothetical protein
MDGEAEAGKALREHRHDPAGVLFPLTADDTGVGTADQKGSPLHPGLDVALVPCIQDRMQIGSKDGALLPHGRTFPPSALRTGQATHRGIRLAGNLITESLV